MRVCQAHRKAALSSPPITNIVIVLGVMAWVGKSLGHDVKAIEDWLNNLGPWGPIIFLVAFIFLNMMIVITVSVICFLFIS